VEKARTPDRSIAGVVIPTGGTPIRTGELDLREHRIAVLINSESIKFIVGCPEPEYRLLMCHFGMYGPALDHSLEIANALRALIEILDEIAKN